MVVATYAGHTIVRGLGQLAKARRGVMCSGDDLADIEAAILAKESNPSATVHARVFKKSLADRISEALRFDIVTFSPYDTAAKTILGEIDQVPKGEESA